MKKRRTSITQTAGSRKSPIVWVGIGIAVGALLVPPGIALAEAVKEVLVTNDASNPVPVAAQGTTTVAGTVDVGNTVPVIAGGEPVVIALSDTCSDHDPAFYTVPEGKRLVVEDVAGRYTAPQGERARPALLINGEVFDLPQTFARTNLGIDTYALHESLRTYAEGSWLVKPAIGCGALGSQEGEISLVVSGYLVNA